MRLNFAVSITHRFPIDEGSNGRWRKLTVDLAFLAKLPFGDCVLCIWATIGASIAHLTDDPPSVSRLWLLLPVQVQVHGLPVLSDSSIFCESWGIHDPGICRWRVRLGDIRQHVLV